jgi:3-hydroxyacyl-[acyl-carrier-protein] dehydratase
MPIMPASLIIEGMAQTAGILVGHAEGFREKVILAKVGLAELDREATPGTTLRYTALMKQIDRMGASTEGTVELWDHARPADGWRKIGRIDLMFSHIDQNMAGLEFPEENFVFGESFRTLLRMSGVAGPH